MPTPTLAFTQHMADLPDPRVERTRKHRLDDILVIALGAVICGADSFEAVERFGTAREAWLKRFLALEHLLLICTTELADALGSCEPSVQF